MEMILEITVDTIKSSFFRYFSIPYLQNICK